jgi:hypothetical protein
MAETQEAKVLDLTPTKPTYDELVERLRLLCNFVENNGQSLLSGAGKTIKERQGIAKNMVWEAREARVTVTLAKHGK